MGKSNRRIESREYKLILMPKEFIDRENGIETALSAIRSAIGAENFKTSDLERENKVEVRRTWYLDIETFLLNEKKFLLRIRKSEGEENNNDIKKYQVTMKCRNPDRYLAASHDLSSPLENIKLKFEEDIVRPFNSKFSISASYKKDHEPELENVNQLKSIFPDFKVLDSIDGRSPLLKVNDFEAYEVSHRIGKIRFGKKDRGDDQDKEKEEENSSDLVLNFWYSSEEDEKDGGIAPLIVEFTFSYESKNKNKAQGNKDSKKDDDELEEFSLSTVRNAERLFTKMQNDPIVDKESEDTKTNFAYAFKRQKKKSQ
jgi:hypothetical protein